MFCPKCRGTIEKDFRFCPWCGTSIEEKTLTEEVLSAELVELVEQLKKYEQLIRVTQTELAFQIRNAFRGKEYLEKYASFEDYGRLELGLGKSMLFMYKDVGEDFIDDNGNLLIARGEEWGIGKLYELRTLRRDFPLNFINALIEDKNILSPGQSLGQVRNDVKALRNMAKQIRVSRSVTNITR